MQQAEAERMDYEGWLHGTYVANAIAACFSKRTKYPQRPLSVKDTPEPEDARSAADMAADFKKFQRAFNANKQAR